MRRRALIALVPAGLLAAGPSRAADRVAFTDAGFATAQSAGGPILIEVTAPWCPTCRAQKPHVDAVAADPRMRGAVLLSLDFDSQKDALRRLNVRSQSTLIVFKGTEERGRATGITDPAGIRDLLFRAL